MVKILYRLMSSLTLNKLKRKTPVEKANRAKKKNDRFDGLTIEEVEKYTLPDYLEMDLDMVFVGINPGLMAAHRGRYYAGPGNHFYKLLHESGLTPRCLTYEEDYKLPQYGIGLTNIVTRATRSSADLKRTEIKEGGKILEEKLHTCKPRIAIFNGKCIYEVFANKTGNFNFGLQPERIGETAVWVTPSSSARCANFPKMTDKLHFFTPLKRYLQFSKGEIKDIDMKEFVFEGRCKQFIPRTSKMWRRKNVSAFLHGGRIANKDTITLDTSDENVAIAHSTEFIVKRLQSDENDKTEKTPNGHESESLQDYGVYISQNNLKTFFKDDEPLQKDESVDVNTIYNKHSQININNVENNVKSQTLLFKGQINNNTRQKDNRRLFQKPVKSNNFGLTTDLEFVHLIKQRLVKKTDDKEIIIKTINVSSM